MHWTVYCSISQSLPQGKKSQQMGEGGASSRILRDLKPCILNISFSTRTSPLCLAPQEDKVSEQSNIGTNEEKPSQLLPYHEHGKQDEEDDSEGEGENVTLLESDTVHGCFFDNGIFSGHHSALLEHNPDQCNSSKAPKKEKEFLKPSPRFLRIVATTTRRPSLLHLLLTPPSTALLILGRGATKFGIVHVVILKVVIDFCFFCCIVVVCCCGPGDAGLADVELNLDIIVQANIGTDFRSTAIISIGN
mmetsp:Transcript_3168/g.7004  ORF Transcript_3168/g.7004 Transcript_3168/m.7004 type:complete len:248 (-) Transcript_3168:654-1397(-)